MLVAASLGIPSLLPVGASIKNALVVSAEHIQHARDLSPVISVPTSVPVTILAPVVSVTTVPVTVVAVTIISATIVTSIPITSITGSVTT